jgi:hypothetical protein
VAPKYLQDLKGWLVSLTLKKKKQDTVGRMGANPCWQRETGISKPARRGHTFPEGGFSRRVCMGPRGQRWVSVQKVSKMTLRWS